MSKIVTFNTQGQLQALIRDYTRESRTKSLTSLTSFFLRLLLTLNTLNIKGVDQSWINSKLTIKTEHKYTQAGIDIRDFQTPDKTSDTIK